MGGMYLANKIVDPMDKKETISFRLKKRNIIRLREIKGYSLLVEQLIENYFAYVDRSRKKK